MTFTVRVRTAAEHDVAGAQDWYEEQLFGLGSAFHREFSEAIDRLAETPLIYPVVYRDVRRAVLHRFPFLVWFRVVGSVVTILACTHGKADPRKVPARLR